MKSAYYNAGLVEDCIIPIDQVKVYDITLKANMRLILWSFEDSNQYIRASIRMQAKDSFLLA